MVLQALLSAVIAAPDDDTPRHVLADAFDELGDARGELIHVGLALEDPNLSDEQRRACAERYEALVRGAGTQWVRELRLPRDVVSFRRGMIEGITLPWADFRPRADQLFAATPLRHLTTWGFTEQGLHEWAFVPWFARLQSLTLRDHEPAVIEAVLKPRELQLRTLLIEGTWNTPPFGRAGTSIIGRWDRLRQLTSLGLIRLGIDASALNELVDRPLRVTALNLTMNRITADGLRVLLRAREGLVRLEVGSNPLGDEGATELASASTLTELEVLRVESTRLSDVGALRLLESPALSRLTHVDLSSNELTDAGAVRLAQVADRGLRFLNVSRNRIGVVGERALRARFGSRVLV